MPDSGQTTKKASGPPAFDPYAGLPVNLAELPMPRMPSGDLEFLIAEAATCLGEKGAGGFERTGSSDPSDTFAMHLAMRKAIKSVERVRRIEVPWRLIPTWWQNVLAAFYSPSRLAPKLIKTRDGAAHKRANALQSTLLEHRLEKVGAWLRAAGSPLSAQDAATDAHKLWEHYRGGQTGKRRESPAQAAKRERDERVAEFERGMGQ